MKIIITILIVTLSTLLPAGEVKNNPTDTVKRWLKYFETGKVNKYVDEALLVERMKEMGISKKEMVVNCTRNKQFFIDTLTASLNPLTVSILDDGDDKLAIYYWTKSINGYVAMSLYKKDKKWVACRMYQKGEPVSSKDKP
jgi:hypothetical protein